MTHDYLAEGRGWPPPASRKAHRFVDTMAICGRWGLYGGPLETGYDDSPDNCAECKRRLNRRCCGPA